jgi:hypothetical protein
MDENELEEKSGMATYRNGRIGYIGYWYWSREVRFLA